MPAAAHNVITLGVLTFFVRQMDHAARDRVDYFITSYIRFGVTVCTAFPPFPPSHTLDTSDALQTVILKYQMLSFSITVCSLPHCVNSSFTVACKQWY